MKQLEIHKKIDEFLKKELHEVTPGELEVLIADNQDAQQYFFSMSDEKWLSWLWENGFLDLLKEVPDTSSSYNYRTPEISYLVKVAPLAQEKVTEIILCDELATTKDKFRPELIDQILRICSTLSQEHLEQIIPKMHVQEWVKIMAPFNHWGFEYEKIFQILTDAKDFKTLLVLADCVLSVKTKEEIEKASGTYHSDNPFYFNELSYTKVFEFLSNVPEEYTEETFVFTKKVVTKIILLGGKTEDGEAFPIRDSFYLLDVDFFTLGPDTKKPLSYRDDVRELVAVMKGLATKLFTLSEKGLIRDYYEKHIKTLPESGVTWRFNLYILSLNPELFAKELRSALFKIFDVERYHEIMSGAEYEKTLEKSFDILSTEDKELYINKVVEYFLQKDKDNPSQPWHIRHGSEIFTVIKDKISSKQKDLIISSGFSFIENYKPEPDIGEMRGGTVKTRGPITQDEFDSMPLDEISAKLRNEWSPKQLHETYKQDDFLNPRNAEGAGDLIRNGVQKRLQSYINSASLFFDPETLDAHYTYSYLRGVEEAVKNNRELAISVTWEPLVNLMAHIAKHGKETPFKVGLRERESGDAWLSGWDSVHSSMADVLQVLLKEDSNILPIDFNRERKSILETISYLLTYQDPVEKDEEIDTASMTTSSGGEPKHVSDPFTMAINSARGRAFQAFVMFIYPDGKKFDKEAEKRIDDDVKRVYEETLNVEKTRAIMFMFGHYLPQFYFRDTEWVQGLLPKIFPEEKEKSHLYLASWEGFIANNLFKEMLIDPFIEKLYFRGINIKDIKESHRKYFRDPDEGIATHLALAFIHYKDFRFENKLFKAFWESENIIQHKEFISFIGRSIISGDNFQVDKLIKEDSSIKEILMELWDRAIEKKDEKEIFMEFGFWINLKKGLFEAVWLAERIYKTLEKTDGVLDWDYGLTQICIELSEKAPKEMLEVTRLFFINGGIKADHQRRPYYVEKEWFDVFKNLVQNPETKAKTIELIDELIREGGSPFWGLKKIVE